MTNRKIPHVQYIGTASSWTWWIFQPIILVLRAGGGNRVTSFDGCRPTAPFPPFHPPGATKMEETFSIQLQEDGRRLKDLKFLFLMERFVVEFVALLQGGSGSTGWWFGGWWVWLVNEKNTMALVGLVRWWWWFQMSNFGFDATKNSRGSVRWIKKTSEEYVESLST